MRNSPHTTSSITAVTRETLSSPSPGRSRLSRSAIGPTSVDQFEDWYKTRLLRRTRLSCELPIPLASAGSGAVAQTANGSERSRRSLATTATNPRPLCHSCRRLPQIEQSQLTSRPSIWRECRAALHHGIEGPPARRAFIFMPLAKSWRSERPAVLSALRFPAMVAYPPSSASPVPKICRDGLG